MANWPPILNHGDVRTIYHEWPTPTVIISDGENGLGDVPPADLPKWYFKHLTAWNALAADDTTLWFWCSDVGWANVHTALVTWGWEFRGLNVWDKGISHAIGRNVAEPVAFPSVTEVCAHYVRSSSAKFRLPTGQLVANTWREVPPKRVGGIQPKPQRLMDLTIASSSDPGDIVWEPFGGTGSGVASAYALGRISYYAESDPDLFDVACKRVNALIDAENEQRAQRELHDLALEGSDES